MDLGFGLMGTILIGVGIAMFVVALPREGKVKPFLDGRDLLQTFYVLAIIFCSATGFVFVIKSLVS